MESLDSILTINPTEKTVTIGDKVITLSKIVEFNSGRNIINIEENKKGEWVLFITKTLLGDNGKK